MQTPEQECNEDSSTGGSRRLLLPLLFLLILVLLFFFDPLCTGRAFFFRDIYNNHLPLKMLQTEMIREGSLPLWNPYLSGGQPLLANLNLFLFHPSTLLFLLLDPEAAVSWTVILNMLLAAVGMYFLVLRLGYGRAGALFASVAFSFSGFMLSLGNLLNMMNTVAWLPVAGAFGLIWLQRKSILGAAGTILSAAMMLFGGDPAIAAAAIPLFLLLIIRQSGASRLPDSGEPRASSLRRRLRSVIVLAGFGAASAGLAALQLIPFQELVSQTVRGWGFTYRGATFWSLHPFRLLELHLPALFGDVNSTIPGALWGSRLFDDGYPLILSVYAGQAVLLFSLCALARFRKDRDVRIWSLLGLLGLILALGGHTPLYRLLYALPVAGGMRFPSRFFLLVALALALLGGREFGRLAAAGKRSGFGRKESPAGLFAVVMGLAVVASAIFALLLVYREPALGVMRQWTASAHPAPGVLDTTLNGLLGRCLLAQLFLFLAAGLGLVAARGLITGRLFVMLGLGILVVDLWTFGAPLQFTVDRSFYRTVPPAAEPMLNDPGLFRVYREDKPGGFRIEPPTPEKRWLCFWDRSLLSPPSGVQLGLQYDLGITTDLLSPRITAETARRMHRDGDETAMRLFRLANVKYLLAFREWPGTDLTPLYRTSDFSSLVMTVYRHEAVLPRARLISRAGYVQEAGEALDRIVSREFEPEKEVILIGGCSTTVPEPVGAGADPGICRLLAHEPNRVEVAVEAREPCWLILADTFYPGWGVEVDGQSREVLRANYLHRAVQIFPGDRQVVFRYEPRSWAVGLLVTVATMLILILCFGWHVIRRRFAQGRGG